VNLVPGPCVQRVVDRQLKFELALVVEAKEPEPLGDGKQAPRLRRRVAILRDIGPVHHAGEQRDSRLVDVKRFDQRLERALAVPVRVSAPGTSKLTAPSRWS
jgi:hypothetical protein